jgi:prolyl-tRNA synthetase
LREEISKFYAKTDEKHTEEEAKGLKIIKKRGIEVGHNFYFATKYSASMKLLLQDASGKQFAPFMGSYGIGVGRLMSAFVEANHDENGIIWHKEISPFSHHIVDLTKSEEGKKAVQKLYKSLQDPLLDDTNANAGEKFAKADLIGIPTRITISDKLLQENCVEVKLRSESSPQKVSLDNLLF